LIPASTRAAAADDVIAGMSNSISETVFRKHPAAHKAATAANASPPNLFIA
jgi:hypothetical protein